MERFKFHHVGIAVHDLAEAIPVYQRLFGYVCISGPFDDPIQKVAVSFSRVERATRRWNWLPRSVRIPQVDRTLKKGGGTYHICYEVPNIQPAIDHLTNAGCFLISGPVPAVAFQMRQIAWLMTNVNLLVELVES